MAAFGCGLLLVMFAVLLVAGLVGDVLNLKGLIHLWPIVLLAVLALFLLMQALPWLVRKGGTTSDADDRDAP